MANERLNAAIAEMAKQDITFANCDSTWQKRVMTAVLEASDTRPAAPVEGLETVESDDLPGCPACGLAGRTGNVICDICTPVTDATDKRGKLETVGAVRQETIDGVALGQIGLIHQVGYDQQPIELVTRSQAESIIAAKDAEIDDLENELSSFRSSFKEQTSLKAENATLTARVKELELIRDSHSQDTLQALLEKQALETQLAAAKKVLEKLTLHSNSLALAHVHKTQKNDGIWGALKEARAALEVKP